MSWRMRQRNKYIFGTLIIIIIIVGVPAYFLWESEPTCFDGVQNQGEKGVDCGGPCKALCDFQVSDINILWSRSFEVIDGMYNSVAYIENPNFKGGIRSIPYTFKLRDEENVIVAEKNGTTFVPPGKIVPVFEPSIKVGERVPQRTTFKLNRDSKWVDLEDYNDPLEVQNIKREFDQRSPKIKADIVNTSVENISEVDVVAVVFNRKGNAIGASQSFIPEIAGGESTSVVFTWPESFEQSVVQVDIKALKPISAE